MQAVVGLLLMAAGALGAISPYSAWYLSTGWKFKDAEPSEAALLMNRLGGIAGVIVGLVVLVSSCSMAGGERAVAKQFQNRLLAGEVRDIKVGFGEARSLSKEDLDQAVELMASSPMSAFDPGNAYGASGKATIYYEDGTTDELVFSPTGGIELHPSSGKAYRFDSTELESLFRSRMDGT